MQLIRAIVLTRRHGTEPGKLEMLTTNIHMVKGEIISIQPSAKCIRCIKIKFFIYPPPINSCKLH